VRVGPDGHYAPGVAGGGVKMTDEPKAVAELTGGQKRSLRAMGRRMTAQGVVGKAGLTAAAVATIAHLFEKHELVKVRLHERENAKRTELSRELARDVGAVWVASVGRTVLLYKQNDDLPRESRAGV